MRTYSTSLFLAVAVSVLTLHSVLQAQVPSIAPPQAVPTTSAPAAGEKTPELPAMGAPSLTKNDAEAWLDGFMPYALQRGDVAGAVVTMVKGGQVLLSKGYGYADVAAHKPVDPDRTLFRAGSVSKLFTWTAVMQLVEQGKLDLDKDINSYLDFKIPPHDGKPITLRNLMTHTPGFDEVVRALLVSKPSDLTSLRDALTRWIPPSVTTPGSTPAYSNYGAALAGYIVQHVSGEPFDDYIERHIFNPLGMKYATFRQPLPARLAPFMAKGYQVASGDAKPFEIISIPPAGSLSISGTDMGRFMIAHLQNGAFGSTRILQQATAVEMHNTVAPGIPSLHHMLLGFYQNDINGHRVITHAGDLQYFHSELNLFPDDGVGLYISVNSLGKDAAAAPIRSMLFREFGDRYFPGPLPEGKVDPATAKQHAQLMAGHYVLSRGSHTNFLSFANLLGQVKVAASGDGKMVVDALKYASGQPKKWREIAPWVWRDVNGGDRLAAQVSNGRVSRFGYDEYPFMVFEPVPWWWSSAWLLPLWIASLVVLALTVIAWPVSALVRRHYAAGYGLTGADARAHLIMRLAALLVLVTMLAWLFTLTMMLKNFDWVAPGMDAWFICLRIVSIIIFIGGSLVALWNAWAVLRSGRRWLAKLWSVVLGLACLAILYVALVFHLMGYTANY